MATNGKAAASSKNNGAKNQAVASKDDAENQIAKLTGQIEELKAALSAIGSTVAEKASDVKDGAKHAGGTALGHATMAANAITGGKEKAKEIPGFETMQTVATLAPIAATVARRVPGGKKIVLAGAAAYATYLILDAVGNARDGKAKS